MEHLSAKLPWPRNLRQPRPSKHRPHLRQPQRHWRHPCRLSSQPRNLQRHRLPSQPHNLLLLPCRLSNQRRNLQRHPCRRSNQPTQRQPTSTPVPIVEPTPRPIPSPILQEDEATRVVAEQDDHRGVKLPLSGISLPLWQLEVLFAVLAGLMVALWAVLRQRSGRRN